MSDGDAPDKLHQLIELLEMENETGRLDPRETRSRLDGRMAGAGPPRLFPATFRTSTPMLLASTAAK